MQLGQPTSWDYLRWNPVSLRADNSPVTGYTAALASEPEQAEAVFAASWIVRGLSHTYTIRHRLGWQDLRAVLTQVGCHTAR